MPRTATVGLPIIGILFLVFGLIRFLDGGPSAVWIIIGFLFGGFSLFKLSGSRENANG